MTRKPLDPIRAGGHTISVPFYGAVRISHLYRDGDVVIRDVNIPALISALTTLAREMGADVPDPVPVVEGLCGHVRHSTTCTRITLGVECNCGAHSSIDAARSYLERTKP